MASRDIDQEAQDGSMRRTRRARSELEIAAEKQLAGGVSEYVQEKHMHRGGAHNVTQEQMQIQRMATANSPVIESGSAHHHAGRSTSAGYIASKHHHMQVQQQVLSKGGLDGQESAERSQSAVGSGNGRSQKSGGGGSGIGSGMTQSLRPVV